MTQQDHMLQRGPHALKNMAWHTHHTHTHRVKTHAHTFTNKHTHTCMYQCEYARLFLVSLSRTQDTQDTWVTQTNTTAQISQSHSEEVSLRSVHTAVISTAAAPTAVVSLPSIPSWWGKWGGADYWWRRRNLLRGIKQINKLSVRSCDFLPIHPNPGHSITATHPSHTRENTELKWITSVGRCERRGFDWGRKLYCPLVGLCGTCTEQQSQETTDFNLCDFVF